VGTTTSKGHETEEKEKERHQKNTRTKGMEQKEQQKYAQTPERSKKNKKEATIADTTCVGSEEEAQGEKGRGRMAREAGG